MSMNIIYLPEYICL